MGKGTHAINGTNRRIEKGLMLHSRVTSSGGFSIEIVSSEHFGGKTRRKCMTVNPVPCEELIF